jgi:hypothetical protein
MEDNIPVTRAEAITEIDARVEAALQRWFSIHLPLEDGGAQHQACPSAPLVYKNSNGKKYVSNLHL